VIFAFADVERAGQLGMAARIVVDQWDAPALGEVGGLVGLMPG